MDIYIFENDVSEETKKKKNVLTKKKKTTTHTRELKRYDLLIRIRYE